MNVIYTADSFPNLGGLRDRTQKREEGSSFRRVTFNLAYRLSPGLV